MKLRDVTIVFVFIVILLSLGGYMKKLKKNTLFYTTHNILQKKVCLGIAQTLKAQHKSCFLRPDTGPCRADIVQWYYDVRQVRCYRFFWGGCQGNGNRFETQAVCEKYCKLNETNPNRRIPYFCSLAFDYGTCFGHFNRWSWDHLSKTCRRRLYSGCGGNQNNFQSRTECMSTCLNPPNDTLTRSHLLTTCIPIVIDQIQK